MITLSLIPSQTHKCSPFIILHKKEDFPERMIIMSKNRNGLRRIWNQIEWKNSKEMSFEKEEGIFSS
jgi:hypothetical protein